MKALIVLYIVFLSSCTGNVNIKEPNFIIEKVHTIIETKNGVDTSYYFNINGIDIDCPLSITPILVKKNDTLYTLKVNEDENESSYYSIYLSHAGRRIYYVRVLTWLCHKSAA